MQNNISKTILSGVFYLFVSASLLAQNERDIHLLYNTVPVSAVVNDSAQIVRILQTVPGYMDGFEGIGTESPKQQLVENKEKKVLKPSNEGAYVVSSVFYDIPFREGYAILDDDAAELLDEIIVELKKYPEKGIIISIFNDYVFTNVYKNRVNAIKSYLKIEGITQDRIKLNYLDGTSNQNLLKIHFIE